MRSLRKLARLVLARPPAHLRGNSLESSLPLDLRALARGLARLARPCAPWGAIVCHCAPLCMANFMIFRTSFTCAPRVFTCAQHLLASANRSYHLRASGFDLRALARHLRRIFSHRSPFEFTCAPRVFTCASLARHERGIVLDGIVLDDFFLR